MRVEVGGREGKGRRRRREKGQKKVRT
jgi:hypothetical protein